MFTVFKLIKEHQMSQKTLILRLFFLVLLISILPALLNYFGIDFASNSVQLDLDKLANGSITANDQFYALKGALQHVIMEWSAVSIALIAGLASFLHFHRKGDVTVPIIGLALLCAGITDAFHTLAATRIIDASAPNSDFIPFTWAFSRVFNASILIVGVLISLWFSRADEKNNQMHSENQGFKLLLWIAGFFISAALISVSIAANSESLPQTTFSDALVTRPYDVLPMALFLFAGALIWSWQQKNPTPMKTALLLALIPEVATQIHMSFGSTALFDNHFNIAHSLKIFAYLCILIGILLDLISGEKKHSVALTPEVAPKQHVIKKGMVEIGKAKHSQLITIPLSVFIMSTIIALFIGGTFFIDSERLVKEQGLKQLKLQGELVEPIFEELYSSSQADVLFLSATPPIQGIIRSIETSDRENRQLWQGRLEQIFKEFLKSHTDYNQVRYIGVENYGKELVKAIRNNSGVIVVPSSKMQHKSEWEYFSNTTRLLPTEVNYSKIELVRKDGSRNGAIETPYRPVLRVSTPIYSKLSGKVFGIIIINIDFGRFISNLKEIGLSEASFYLANQDGDFLFHQDQSKEFGFDLKKRYFMQEEFFEVLNVFRENQRSYTYRSDESDQQHPSLYYKTMDFGKYGEDHLLRLIITLDQDAIDHNLQKLKNRSFIIGLGLGILALALAVIVSRRITRPLLETINGVKDFQKTGVLPKLPINEKDEVGVLARSFHNMIISQKLKDQEFEEQRFAFDQHSIVAITDVKGTIIYANKLFESISGFSYEELIGANHRILNSGYHEKEFFINMYRTIAKGKVWHQEVCNKNKEGDIYWVDTTIVPFLDPQNKPISYIAIRTDITERKQTELELIESKKAADLAVIAKSTFLASMSHEIRTPMNGVIGMLGLLKNTDLDKEQLRRANLAEVSAQSLLTLINDILDFSKVEAGKLELEILEFDLRSMLGEFAESISLLAHSKKLELILDVINIEQSMVKGDPGRIRQILNNFVSNAIKFTEKGEVVIKASTKIENNEIVFICSIVDTGIGIPEDKIEFLFDSFSQVDASTTRKYGGTGLGLSIAKNLCELMNGGIEVTSQLGKGSCFKFNLKLGISKKSVQVLPAIDMTKLNILVVDDNATNREVLSEQLKHWGATVFEAKDSREALSKCALRVESRESFYDIAFLDMQMPEMDGEALASKLVNNPKFKEMKLIMMSSLCAQGDAQKFADLGFSGYFPKPATTEDLFDALAVISEGGQALENASPLVTSHYIRSVKKNKINEKAEHNWPADCRILLVEDNRINQIVASEVIKNFGLHVDIAANGLEAITSLKEAVSEKQYCLVLMDCQMPEMDGYEATRAIRSGEAGVENKSIPILAMTANAMQGDKQKCIDAGMDDYLTKPILGSSLLEKLYRWLKPTV